MTEDKNTPTDEITYTPMLSKFFPSFSGTCTKEEFQEAGKTCFIFTIIWGGLLALVMSFASDNLYLCITLLSLLTVPYCLLCIKNVLPQMVRRFHSFGMNYTGYFAIPFITVISLVVAFSLSKEAGGQMIGAFLMILLFPYVTVLWCICYFRNSREDEKLSAQRKKALKRTVLSASKLKLR